LGSVILGLRAIFQAGGKNLTFLGRGQSKTVFSKFTFFGLGTNKDPLIACGNIINLSHDLKIL